MGVSVAAFICFFWWNFLNKGCVVFIRLCNIKNKRGNYFYKKYGF